MKEWEKAKQKFIEKLGGLIYESPDPITFMLDESTRETRFNSFIDWVSSSSEEIANFFEVNAAGFYDNKTVVDFKPWNFHRETIPSGMKIGKVLNKYFLPDYGADIVEPIRLEASRLIQENSVTGKLCLSVHPLDYLSVSENNHKWRSCHALDGEYRSGNLSYMVDNCTVIAYLKSEENAVLPRFPSTVPWNNKKWRCLLYFDFNRKVVWAGRQYPFSCKSALKIVQQKLLQPFNYFIDKKNVIPFCEWERYVFKGAVKIGDRDCFLSEPYIAYGNHISPLHNWIQDKDGSMQFNDLINSSCYLPEMLHFGFLWQGNIKDQKPMEVGGAIPCICCGEKEVEFSETMMCRDCVLASDIEMDEIGTCAYCGERIFLDLDYNWEGQYYCPTCFNEHVVTCNECGETFFTLDKEAYYVKDAGTYMCYHCRKYRNE